MMYSKISSFLITFFLLTITLNVKADEVPKISLKQKIGQMLMIGFPGTELQPNDKIVQAILSQQIGGVILFDYDAVNNKYGKNIQDPNQLAHLTRQLQIYTKKAAALNKNNLSPLLIGIDYEGGKVNRLKEKYGFPSTLSAAEIGEKNLEEAKQYADNMANTLQQVGINLNFAPVVDVNVNPDNPIIAKYGRAFSSHPGRVAEYATLFSQAYKKRHILCAYKHFPGHGSSKGDTHAGFVDVSETWQISELVPYQFLYSPFTSCPMVMAAHVVHYGLDSKGYPASISSEIIQNLLRDKLKFDGVVITDDMQMKAITQYFGTEEAVKLAINAGVDILVFANQLESNYQDPQDIIAMIYKQVKMGQISEQRINEAYQRILKIKQTLYPAQVPFVS